jgi:putative protease
MDTPELLAPAGDMQCARAAVENGADAVYFGLSTGLNARARAANFTPAELPELMQFLHRRGVKGYVTLNTLVFSAELAQFEEAVRLAVSADVDAALVQDLGAVRLARALCPDWPIHASTQMSLTSAEGIRVAESLGIRRVVLARELSLPEIRQIRAATGMELEVFVHGALCISYSGQCLASLAMGGRSGNRGQCAQPCRLPYDLLCDGREVDLDGRNYLWSPLDLAAYDLLPELLSVGLQAVKIEGRLKSAEYVAAVTGLYRRALDEAACGRRAEFAPGEKEALELAFSRGFAHGWLEGRQPKILVPGDSSAKRGIFLGEVRAVRPGRVTVELSGPLRRGDGLVFAADRGSEQGGRVYGIFRRGQPLDQADEHDLVELSFARKAIRWDQLEPGQKVWKTDDPHLLRRLRRTYAAGPSRRRVPLDLLVEAGVGRPLRITAHAGSNSAVCIQSPQNLQEAVKHPLTAEVLQKQLGRLGDTVFQLRHLEARIEGRPMAPLSVLGQMRHALIDQLDQSSARGPRRVLPAASPLPALRAAVGAPIRTHLAPRDGIHHAERDDYFRDPSTSTPRLHVLCRSLPQVRAIIGRGVSHVVADLAEPAPAGRPARLPAGRAAGPQPGGRRVLCPTGPPAGRRLLARCGQ